MRRRTLLEDLTEMAERDNLLMFEEVGKIALEDEDADVLVSAIDLLFQAEDSRLIPTSCAFSKMWLTRGCGRRPLMRWSLYLSWRGGKIHPDLLQNIVEVMLNIYANDISDLVRRRVLGIFRLFQPCFRPGAAACRLFPSGSNLARERNVCNG